METKKSFMVLKFFLVFLLGLLFVACGKDKEEKQEVRVIKVSHVFQTSEPTHIYIQQAADRCYKIHMKIIQRLKAVILLKN